ncbi:MAG: CatB-related O-acetyltransferase [Bacteroidales bacterium]|nr:CatB-related O-acetyltransferase [Bacteroidales bacterium]
MKRIFKKILLGVIPELRILRDSNYDFSILSHWQNCIDNKHHIILYAPYSITDTEIGDYTYISSNSQISKTIIGKFCSIGPNLLCGWGIHPTNGITTSPMFYSTRKQNGITLSDSDKVEERKPINIGNDVFIGANVTILDGVTIGDGAVIGAGAVVSKDIPPYAVAVGCPIKIIRYRFDEEKIKALRKIEWWNFDEEKLKEVESYFFDIEGFIEKNL